MQKLEIIPNSGTHVLGTSFGRLVPTYRDYYGDNFVHHSTAILHYEDDWLFADSDPEISRYYRAMISKRFGVKVMPKGSRIYH